MLRSRRQDRQVVDEQDTSLRCDRPDVVDDREEIDLEPTQPYLELFTVEVTLDPSSDRRDPGPGRREGREREHGQVPDVVPPCCDRDQDVAGFTAATWEPPDPVRRAGPARSSPSRSRRRGRDRARRQRGGRSCSPNDQRLAGSSGHGAGGPARRRTNCPSRRIAARRSGILRARWPPEVSRRAVPRAVIDGLIREDERTRTSYA